MLEYKAVCSGIEELLQRIPLNDFASMMETMLYVYRRFPGKNARIAYVASTAVASLTNGNRTHHAPFFTALRLFIPCKRI